MKKVLLFLSIAALIIGSNANAQVVFNVLSPSGIKGNYDFTHTSGWGADMLDPLNAITDTAVIVDDGTVGDSLGCNALVNGADISGQIAVIYRGVCEFGAKSLNAQNAGARGVIIINRIPGEGVFPMGAGAVGTSVTIPVVMISYEDGKLFRDAIDAGDFTVFIGNKDDLYANDMGFVKSSFAMPRSLATPKKVIAGDSLYTGSWVHNYGSANQTGVILTVEIKKGSTVVYNQASTPASILKDDSAFFSLPNFAPTDTGYYSIKYTISDGSADGFPQDNEQTVGWWVGESIYSHGRIDAATRQPLRTRSARPAPSATTEIVNEFRQCILIDEGTLTEPVNITGVSFAAALNKRLPGDMVGQDLEIRIEEWNNLNLSSFDSLVNLYTGTYTYATDPKTFVTHKLTTAGQPDSVMLQDNKRYLACVVVNSPGNGLDDRDSITLGYDSGIDYNQTWTNNQTFFPLFVKEIPTGTETWYNAGFGSDMTPAIVVHTKRFPNMVSINGITKTERNPAYPNPARQLINIPLNAVPAGDINLKIYDVVGKLVKTEMVKVSGNQMLTVNTTDIPNGVYVFNLIFNNNTQTSFRVSITK